MSTDRDEPAADREPAGNCEPAADGAAGIAHGGATAAGSPFPRRRALDAKHARIFNALVDLAAEHGFAGATVRRVCQRTGMSRRTFYECFDGLEDCFSAVLDRSKQTAVEIVTEAFDREEHPNDGLRAAAAALLVFLDEEPAQARVLLAESLAAGQRTLEHRERILAELREAILARLSAANALGPPPFAAEAETGAVLALLHSRVVKGRPAPFIEMLGAVMGIIAVAHLQTPAVERESRTQDSMQNDRVPLTRTGPPERLQ